MSGAVHIAVLSVVLENGDAYALVVDGVTVSTHRTAAEAIRAREVLRDAQTANS